MITFEQQDRRVSTSIGELATVPVARKGESERDPLGNTASIASTVCTSQKSQHAIDAKKRRYALQTIARKLLPSERIRTCHRDTIPGSNTVDILVNSDRSTASFCNLQTCNSVWACPVCAAKISEKRREELSAALANGEFRAVLVTYTLRHRLHDPLSETLETLKESRRSLKSGRWWQSLADDYGIAGSVTSHEVTWSGRNGWHPHAHELMLLPKDISDVDLGALAFLLKRQWIKTLKAHDGTAEYEYGLDVQTAEQWVEEYVVKWGHEPSNRPWTPAHEVTKAVNKSAGADGFTPWQLLEKYGEGDQQAGALFQEYFHAFKGSHQLQWAPGTRALLGMNEKPETDEEIGEIEEPGEPLETLAYEQWKYILKDDRRGELLEIASHGDKGMLRVYFDLIGLPEAVITVDFEHWNTEGSKSPPLPDKPVFGMTLPQQVKR